MFSGHDVPVIFLSINSVTRHPRPSAGSLGRLSLLHRYHEVLRLAVRPPALLRSSRRSAVLRQLLAAERPASPRFLGDPCSRATLFDPGGTSVSWSLRTSTASGLHCSRRLSPALLALPVSHSEPSRCLAASRPRGAAVALLNNAGSHDQILSGLNRAAHTLAVYASQDRSPDSHARLASGWGPAFAGRDFHPQGRS
jgi:hypothetical protein